MKITAVTKFKHGTIHRILSELGWNQSKLARKSGIHASNISAIILLKRTPSEKEANAIQKTFGEEGFYIDVLSEWPESFKGFNQGCIVEETRDLDPELLLPAGAPVNIDIDAGLNELPKRSAFIIQQRFFHSRTLESIGKELSLSRDRVRQIEAQALRKLSHPTRLCKILKEDEKN